MRRHPLYSTRLTLRTAAVTASALVAAIGAIVASANLTFALQAVILVACAVALMFIIQAVSTPKAAKLTVELPPSAKLVHNHRRKIYKWTEFFAILAVFLGIMAMLLRGEARAANGGSRGRLAGWLAQGETLRRWPIIERVAERCSAPTRQGRRCYSRC